MKETWVQDADATNALSIISEMTRKNEEYIRNTGAIYIIGPSKNGSLDYVGIYFRDPTSK
jgi:hypothetical protein